MSATVTLPAFAKINLTLDVGERRADGYHQIRSVMQTVGLHDTVRVTRTPERPGIHLEVRGAEASGVPTGPSNLVHKAAVRLQKVAAARGVISGRELGLHILVEKCIPSQAGLGGGSSDAATTLQAVNTLFGLALSRQRLEAIGAELGADVPFFLTGGTALAEGLGERVTPLRPLAPPWDLVIVKPPVGVSTAWAYGALDALPVRVPGQSTAAWLAGRQEAHNDFWSVAVQVPEIAAVYQWLRDFRTAPERHRQTPPLLCGSGSAILCRVIPGTLVADDGTCLGAVGNQLASRVQQVGLGKTWVTQTVGAEAWEA